MFSVLLWSLVLLLLFTGIAQPLVIQWIKYLGIGNPESLVYMIPNYLGMTLLYIVPPKFLQAPAEAKEIDENNKITRLPIWAKVVIVSVVDVFSFSGCLFGSLLCGTGLYSIIYGTVPVFTAVLAWIFLGKKLSILQWSSCVFVTVGLSLAGVDVVGHDNDFTVIIGCIIVFVCTLLHSSMYVLNEAVMNKGSNRLPPIRLCAYVGIFGLVIMVIWQCIYTFPNYREIFLNPLYANTTWGITIGVYILALVVDLFHAVINQVGSVTTGIVKGVTTASVFIFSAIFFCNIQESQCFTKMKAISLSLVVIGVLKYSYATHLLKKKELSSENASAEPLLSIENIAVPENMSLPPELTSENEIK